MAQSVLAIAEQVDGAFRKVTFEAVSEGKRLAAQMGGELAVLVLGDGVADIAGELAAYGADRILVADHGDLAEYMTDTYTHVSGDVIAAQKPWAVVLGASTRGRDLAARLAARLAAPLAMDCLSVALKGETLTAVRPVYAGKLLARVALHGEPKILALRPNTFEITETAGAGAVTALTPDLPERQLAFVEKQVESGKVELTEADAVVTGGRGMGGDDFSLVEQLAELLGGAVGASRSAVDEGWRSHADQVGQTGKVVSPNLYIACGVSGAIQHLAGMSTSKVIVAINKDSEAPIFAKADYGIVGDLFEIVPALTEEIRKLKG